MKIRKILGKTFPLIRDSYFFDMRRMRGKFFVFLFNSTPSLHVLSYLRGGLLKMAGFNLDLKKNFFRGKIFVDCPKKVFLRSGYMNWNISFEGGGKIFIGDKYRIAPNVSFVTSDHKERETKYLNIRVGKNVWIGAGTIVIGGAVIGDNVIIGAGSVVPKGEYRNIGGGGFHCMLEILQDILSK